jgi:tetratricopeptide (TPR) repeat protein
MPTTSKDRASAEIPSQGTRLDSWKEIAAYLCRGERTVKRWETDRGLPIHRLPGGGRASVYAYSSELDEWLKSSEARELTPAQEDAENEEVEVFSVADAIAAENAVSEKRVSPELVAAKSRPNRKWLLVFAGVVVAAIAGAAVQLIALRSGNLSLSRTVLSLFSKNQPKASLTAMAVSDSERNLARDLYLKGRYEWNQRTPDSLNRALDSFTQAIVHDPSYAQAYVGLADTYDLLREYSTMPESDAYQRAVAAARKAVELDDSLAEAHRALAFAEFWGAWDFADAEKEFRRAIELNPKDPVARRWYANSFAMPGRFAECLEQINKAQELDPSSHATLADKGIMLFQAGRTSEGIELLKEVERADPEFRSPHFYMTLISLYLRDYPTYLKEGQRAAEATNDSMLRDIITSAQRGYSREGGRGLLKELYASQKKYYLAGKLPGTTLAKTCVMMGKKQEALQLLEDAYARHEPYLLTCLVQPDLLTLKDEPRYKELVKKINFPRAPGEVLAPVRLNMN